MAGREITYGVKVGVGVQGADSLNALANRLDDVSKVLDDDLAAAARTAATRLRELGEQDQAITDFTKLRTEATNAARALKSAEAEAGAYAKQIAAAGPPTAAEAANMARLQAAVTSAKTAVDQQGQALASAQSTLQKFGIAGDQAGVAQKRLRTEAAAVALSVKDIAPAYGGVAEGAQNAAAAMTRTHRQIGDGVQSISTQLGRMQALYASLAGLQGAKAMAMDLAETADAAKDLQARMGLVVGEAAATGEAWDAVTQIALRTYSALEGTGTLFTKVAQQGQDAGLTVEQAQARSLALTETINRAIQLGGASAQASDAALTQLIQGLNGGALRGEEFNSVMEQAPRLARALAEGLGVTTGELRKMAEAGALTSDTVITALQSQSQVLESEFSRLPVTVGRSIQNLTTSWTLYVAEADKGSEASANVAKAINLVAANLDTLVGLLIDAGQAAAAFAALRLAQTFLGIGTAAAAAATQVAATNAQLTATQAAAAGAASGVGRIAGLLGTLRTFTLVGIVANFKDIGTWIGEATARLMGYKDRTEELARAEKASAQIARESAEDRQRLATTIREATERTFDLSKAARASLAEFAKLTSEGTSAAEAVKKVTDGFDLTKIQGVRDFSSVLDKLAADGKLSAAELQAAWAQALKGEDLARFETVARAAFATTRGEAEKAAKAVQEAMARGVSGKELEALQRRAEAAFAATTREAEKTAQVMDAVLREAVQRAGLDFDNLRGGISATSRSAINDVEAIVSGLDRLKAQGIDTGRTLSTSLAKAINTADSQAAIDAVRARVESLRTVLGSTVTNGLLEQATQKARELRQAVEDTTPGIQSVAEAMRQLGITSDASLRETAATAKSAYDSLASSGKASARELSEGFRRAADAAIAANNGVAPGWVQAQAAVRGYSIEADRAGRDTLRAVDDMTKGVGGLAGSWQRVGNAISSAADQLAEFQRQQNLAEQRERHGRPGEFSQGNGKDNYDPGYGSPYSRPGQNPVNGQGKTKAEYDREQALKGQNAVDNSLLFEIRDRLRAGTLTEQDLPKMEAAIEALAQNAKINNDLNRINPGGISTQGMASALADQRLRAQLQDLVQEMRGAGGSSANTTYTINLTRPSGATEQMRVSSQGDVDALLRVLGDAGLRT